MPNWVIAILILQATVATIALLACWDLLMQINRKLGRDPEDQY
jgi:hypothetical protein